MAKVQVNLGERSYPILVESGILPRIGEEIGAVCRGRAALIVTEPAVSRLYYNDVSESLSRAGFQTFLAEIPGGEENKTLAVVAGLYDRLLDIRMDRSGVLITLGGGVVGDIGGFAAATYMRGIDFIQIPTTLLAQVDASIGGKVGVDLPRGKNLVGAFYQPKIVIIDPDVLVTLPKRQLVSGLAEVVKHGIIADLELFNFSSKEPDALLRMDRDALEFVIARSCEIKAAVVTADERESGHRAILNYGHTVGHAIEAVTNFAQYTHGEAVSIGMVTATLISETAGLAAPGLAADIAGTLRGLELPIAVNPDVNLDLVIQAMVYDKKFVSGKLRLVLPMRIGEVRIVDTITKTDVINALIKQAELFGE